MFAPARFFRFAAALLIFGPAGCGSHPHRVKSASYSHMIISADEDDDPTFRRDEQHAGETFRDAR